MALVATQYPMENRPHRSLEGPFADGAAYTTDPISADIGVAGDSTTRLYFKASTGGTLSFQWLRPHKSPARSPSVYDSLPAEDQTVVADTQLVVDIPNEGESALRITWTADGSGTITFADVAHLSGF